MKKFIGITLLSLFLVGCGQDDVSLVKNGVLGIDKSLTVGKAIDNYGACSSVTWESFVTDNGRKMVEADCQLTEEAKEYVFYKNNLRAFIVRGASNQMAKEMVFDIVKLWKKFDFKDKEKIKNFELGAKMDIDYLKKALKITPSEIDSHLIIQFVINKDNSFKLEYVGIDADIGGKEVIEYPTYDSQTMVNIYKNLMPSTMDFSELANGDLESSAILSLLAYPYAKVAQSGN